jgi:hypothetical protein
MGCIPYQTVRDALQSLHRNIILYKGSPHYVYHIVGPNGVCTQDQITLQLHTLPLTDNSRVLEVRLDDPEVDVSSMRLGFVNRGYDALWCSRFPHRGNAQGLVDNNVATYTITKFGDEARTNFSHLWNYPAFTHQFTGGYPTVSEILKAFEEDKSVRSRAFDRRFAISRDQLRGDYIVHYKIEAVGYGNIERGQLKLANGFSYLKEQFQEAGFNVVT